MDQCILKTDPLLICIHRKHIFPMCTCELQKILYSNTNPTFLCKYLSFEMKFGDFYWGQKCSLEQGICIWFMWSTRYSNPLRNALKRKANRFSVSVFSKITLRQFEINLCKALKLASVLVYEDQWSNPSNKLMKTDLPCSSYLSCTLGTLCLWYCNVLTRA